MATITVAFTPASPVPADGYIVKYRKIGTLAYTTVSPNPTASPVVITPVANGEYEVTVQSDCVAGDVSTIVTTAPSMACITVTATAEAPGGGQVPPNDEFFAKVAIPGALDQNLVIDGYIVEDAVPSNIGTFSLTITSGTLDETDATATITVPPASPVSVVITKVSPFYLTTTVGSNLVRVCNIDEPEARCVEITNSNLTSVLFTFQAVDETTATAHTISPGTYNICIYPSTLGINPSGLSYSVGPACSTSTTCL